MSENRPRRVVAEIRFSEGRSPVAKVAGRSIHQYWTLLAAHFRDVLLAPQRRSDDGGVSWTWKEAADMRPVSAADLDRVRKRIQAALESFVDSPGSPAGGTEAHRGLEAQTTVEQLTIRVSALVQGFAAMADPELAQFVCRTETGPMIHSWGLDTPAPLEYPDATESEIIGTVFAGRNTPADHDVVLENANGLRMARVTSDSDGLFRFRHLRPGRYRVRVLSDRVKFPPKGEAVTLERGASASVELRSEGGSEADHSETPPPPGSPEPSPASNPANTRQRPRRGLVIGALVLLLVLAGGYAGLRVLRRSSGPAAGAVRESYMTPERYESAADVTVAPRGSSQSGSPSLNVRGTKPGLAQVPVETPGGPADPEEAGVHSSTIGRGTGSSAKPFASTNLPAGGGGVGNRTGGADFAAADAEHSSPSQRGGIPPSSRRPGTRRTSAAGSRDVSTPVAAEGAPPVGEDAVDVGMGVSSGAQSESAPTTTAAGQASAAREIVNTTRVQADAKTAEPPLPLAQSALAGGLSDGELPISTPAAGVRKPGGVLLRASGKGKGLEPATVAAANANEGSLPEMPRAESDDATHLAPGEAAGAALPQTPASTSPGPRAVPPRAPTGTSFPPDRSVDESAPPDERVPPPKRVAGRTKLPAPPPSQEAGPLSLPRVNETETRLVQEQDTGRGGNADAPPASRRDEPLERERSESSEASSATPADALSASSAAAPAAEMSGRSAPAAGPRQLAPVASKGRAAVLGEDRATSRSASEPVSELPALRLQGSFSLSSWSARLARDMIVPSHPVRAGERDLIDTNRRRLLDDEKRRLPASFRKPAIICDLVLTLPESLRGEALAWNWSNKQHGAAFPASSGSGAAQIGWRVGAPPRDLRAKLVRGDSSLVAEVSFDASGRCSVHAIPGVSACARIAVTIAAEDRRDSGPRFVWRDGELPEHSAEQAVVRIPLAAGSAREVPLVLQDRQSGWVLRSTLMLGPDGR